MTVCVDGAELAAVQRRAKARRRPVVVGKEGSGEVGEGAEEAEGEEEEEIKEEHDDPSGEEQSNDGGDDDDLDDDDNDDDDDDDEEEEEEEEEDEWDWSGELSLEAEEVGRRQRVCLQSERGRLRLLACELVADGAGVLHATLFEEPQPPLVLRNHTQHTIFLGHASASALGDAPPFPAPSHEVLKLGPGRTGRFFMEGVGRRAATIDGTPSAAPSSAPSSTPAETLLLLGLQRDMVAGYNPAMGAVPGGAALRLAPPRVLSLRLLPPRDHSGDRTSSGYG